MKALFFLAIAVIACYIAYTIYAFNKIPKSMSYDRRDHHSADAVRLVPCADYRL